MIESGIKGRCIKICTSLIAQPNRSDVTMKLQIVIWVTAITVKPNVIFFICIFITFSLTVIWWLLPNSLWLFHCDEPQWITWQLIHIMTPGLPTFGDYCEIPMGIALWQNTRWLHFNATWGLVKHLLYWLYNGVPKWQSHEIHKVTKL